MLEHVPKHITFLTLHHCSYLSNCLRRFEAVRGRSKKRTHTLSRSALQNSRGSVARRVAQVRPATATGSAAAGYSSDKMQSPSSRLGTFTRLAATHESYVTTREGIEGRRHSMQSFISLSINLNLACLSLIVIIIIIVVAMQILSCCSASET